MSATKTRYVHIADGSAENEYRGKRTRTGNSYGFRFDRAFFKSHPEFAGELKAHVIAPGRMLVSVAEPIIERRDPVMQSFLAFLANDIAKAPEGIKPMSPELARRIDRLVEEVSVLRMNLSKRKACSDGGQWLDALPASAVSATV